VKKVKRDVRLSENTGLVSECAFLGEQPTPCFLNYGNEVCVCKDQEHSSFILFCALSGENLESSKRPRAGVMNSKIPEYEAVVGQLMHSVFFSQVLQRLKYCV
jgi:hypothetical protein